MMKEMIRKVMEWCKLWNGETATAKQADPSSDKREKEPERGRRCLACFKHRLLVTAECAKREGIELYTTTLAGSRWKSAEQIREAAAHAKSLIPESTYWDVNWKKGGLQERRGILLKENGFYNQRYCGCEFSMGHLTEEQRIEILKR